MAHRRASLPVMGVLTNTISAREAFLLMSFWDRDLLKIYVPFVASTGVVWHRRFVWGGADRSRILDDAERSGLT
jgi:hypothetical protein